MVKVFQTLIIEKIGKQKNWNQIQGRTFYIEAHGKKKIKDEFI